jgi:hypothetical protein
MTSPNREEWLQRVVEELKPWFSKAGHKLPDNIYVSVGNPTSRKSSVIAEAWSSEHFEDDADEVVRAVVHELVHVIDDCKNGHKKVFQDIAKSVGLVSPWTGCKASDELSSKVQRVLNKVGPYRQPVSSAVFLSAAEVKPGSRMIKLVAEGCCDYSVRTTRIWIDLGLPSCPHGTEMKEV